MNNLLLLLVLAEEKKPPADKDVVAGGWGLTILIALIIAVALLCWSFTRHIRKAKLAKEAGVYGDVPAADDEQVPEPGTETGTDT